MGQGLYVGLEERWQSRRTLSSPPPTRTQKSHLTAEQPSVKKNKAYQKRYSTSKTKKKPQQDGRRGAHVI